MASALGLGRRRSVEEPFDVGVAIDGNTASPLASPHPREQQRQRETSVLQALEYASVHLAPITATPQLEAEVLLSHVRGCSRAALLAHPERELSPQEWKRYQDWVQKRATGYPLPYITRRVEFYDLEFDVSPEVLIPRPETEMLVDLALRRHPQTVVDVGTGSGCIAITLAVHLPQALVYAFDISPQALAVAQQNAERHGVAERVIVMASDVLTTRPNPVDLIVSNPPYIPSAHCAGLPISVQYEPPLALDGGPDGLDIIRRLLSQAPAVLQPGGSLLVEIGADQGATVRELAQAAFPTAAVRIHPDMAGLDRVLEVQT